ncbi:MAG TPA: Hsp70 family protein [Thermoanaerobaculia bacterium]|nr:Hsp70 family protein [Thermoanaerobaculia bacterium]
MRAIGIDLGTTNSVGAVGGAENKVLPSLANEALTPSIVGYVKRRKATEGEIVVGRQALNNAVRDPANTIFSIKRLMGRVYGEPRVEEVQKRFHYQLAAAPPPDHEDQAIRVLLNGSPHTPTAISAMILRQVKDGAELALGERVTHAVITVPAYFEERQRKATADAGEAAGLKVVEIIDEPTAAAIAFGVGREQERHRVLVYDLGGGTFDISIIQMTAGQYTVLEIAGNNWLGGDDFDYRIVRRMIDWVKDEWDYDPSSDVAFITKAKIEAERAKIALSAQQSHVISAPLMVKVPDAGPVDVELEITREMFENDIRPLVQESVDLVRGALERQHLSADDITEVLLVGGSTAVPLVQQEMYALFGQSKVKRHVNPMECVALGAAILAAGALLEDEPDPQQEAKGPRVHGVTAMHLGIAAVKGENPDTFVHIIPRGTPYPLTRPLTHNFYPSEDNQTLISIPVYEGLSDRASYNEQQGVIAFPLPEGIAMSTPVEVSFNYDSNRFLTVGVRVVGTDQSYSEILKRDRPRVRPASQNLVDDWREDLQPSLKAASHFVDTYGDYMTPEDRQEVTDAMRQGQEALEQGNESEGQMATLVLRNKVLGSGTASLLFIAERTMHGLSPDQSQLMAQAVASLRTAHRSGNTPEVERLSGELRVVVAQLMTQRMSIRGVEDRKSWDGLLRVATE